MAVFHDKPPQLAVIAGKVVMSVGVTGALGGTLTGCTTALMDANSSGLLTWAPPFVSAPVVLASINSGPATTTSPVVRLTGITVSNAYLTMGESPLTNVTVGVVIIGEARL